MLSRSVSNSIYRTSLNNLRQKGIDTNSLLGGLGLSTHEIDKPYGRITEHNHYQLMAKISGLNKTLYGSAIPETIYINSVEHSHAIFPELIGLCLNEKTLESALWSYSDNRFLIGNCDDLFIEKGQSHTRVRYKNHAPHSVNNPSAIFNLVLLGSILKSYSPGMSMQIELTESAVHHQTLVNDLFNKNCLLRQEHDAIILDNRYLDCENTSFNPLLNRLQKSHVSALKKQIFKEPPLTTAVNTLIEQCYLSGQETSANSILEKVCLDLRISRWTLNRRLQLESATFTQLLNQQQLLLSMRMLRESTLSIQEISDCLGFSSHSVYSRFFKNHVQLSPLQFRDKGRDCESGS
ncbi:helix-turn-helix domain-containing protein [Enterobacteriaceae bacterium RIT711]|nr:helix-turn-helix domain-containing protein [Enterobacteriaceae bacterium RIT711]